jgi:hypothetical protein
MKIACLRSLAADRQIHREREGTGLFSEQAKALDLGGVGCYHNSRNAIVLQEGQ